MRSCAARRPSAARNASHSGTISASGGRLFTSTRRFVSASTSLSNDADLLVGLERGDDLVELRNRRSPKEGQRRQIEGHAPIRRRSSRQQNSSGAHGHWAMLLALTGG
jgi:hypothetical protein